MRQWARVVRALALALLPGLTGCATLLQGSTQMVQIRSDPPGATATVLPERETLVTPGEIDLARKQVHTVVFELACYEPATGYLDRVDSKAAYLNLIFGGLVGLFVDLDSGAAYSLTPDPLRVVLERDPDAAGSAAGPSECASGAGVADEAEGPTPRK